MDKEVEGQSDNKDRKGHEKPEKVTKEQEREKEDDMHIQLGAFGCLELWLWEMGRWKV